jgi:hypothetical protein
MTLERFGTFDDFENEMVSDISFISYRKKRVAYIS